MYFSKSIYPILLTIILVCLSGCSGGDDDKSNDIVDDSFFASYETRKFKMGFTTWPYAPTEEALTTTQTFLDTHADIYSEHIDSEIPWGSYINDTPLPSSFTEMIANRKARRTSGKTMTLSVSLLNLDRSDLMPDFDGVAPSYGFLNDTHIEDAYYKHVTYLLEQLTPNYLVISVEADGLLKQAPGKWEDYKKLMKKLKNRIKNEYPTLPISESMMLHGFYQPDFGVPENVVSEVTNYLNSMDFAAVSFYPFLKGLKTETEFQLALNFLHANIEVPIAFAETGHLSEDLSVEGFDLFIEGNQLEQDNYLQSLLINAQERKYEYIIWWTHRDYDVLWETFPEDLKDLGKLWISTGIINEDGTEKTAFSSWKKAYSK